MTTTGTPPPSTTAPTIAQIAREVGVSAPTVSKVLNGRTDVADSTRTRVEDALERAGYRRRRAAPPAAGTGLIDLVFHHFGSIWSLGIIRGVEKAAAAARSSVILSELGGLHRPPQTWLDATLLRPPVGVLLVASGLSAPQRRQLVSRGIPFVVIDTDGEPPVDVPVVGSDNWNGGLVAARHLLQLGHRRIAVISGPADMLCSRARLDGFRSAFDGSGVTFDPHLRRTGDFEVESGYRAGRDLLDRPDRPTAVFAGSDMQALGVLRAARDLGLRVPEDLSVVGYDDVPLAQWTAPALTTVRQPLEEMGSAAARMLFELADQQTPLSTKLNLGTDLIVRETTAPPPP
ncbi:LacI family transcriptional regulator [Isoptericola jiangsuensis]|uniref:LacI family transcriptional regulator n=1 Tax=Isoptericola jiangsuensis TaxID=548579 RepID=A0A2A9EUL7_9MICO|nr:LacI family DNA-binding transcriptional regulator [Isoptericola jiangsuensis]PFG41972.1 LacI family transcriptional regulator [Isoptericola jiangsuensis]